MRALLIAFPLMFAAAPAAAQQYPQPGPEVERVLNDPAMADTLGRVAGVLTRSLMNLPVGEMEAAIEGRPVTPADRARTVRDSVGDPDLDRRVAAEAAQSGRTMQAAGKAIMGAIGQAQDAIERAVANMPNPNYPRR